MAIPSDVGTRNQQAFIETSSGVVARRSHISGGTLTAISGTVPVNVKGGTIDTLTSVVGTVNVVAILGTITNLQNGTLDILKAGTLDMVKAGTVSKVSSGTINTVDMLSAGTVTTVGMIQAGTVDMLKAGTLDILKAGTLDIVKAGTIDKVASGTISTVSMVQAGTLDMVKAGTVSMLSAGTVTTVAMLQAGTLDMVKAGTVGISQWGGTAVTGGAALSDTYTGPTVPPVGAFLMGYDGTNWERVKTDTSNNLNVNLATLISGEDQTNDVMKTEQQMSYSHIAAAGTTTVKSAAGLLHLLTINTAGATGTITLTDGTAGGGGTIAVASGNAQTTLGYNVKFTTALSCIIAAGTAPDITISYR